MKAFDCGSVICIYMKSERKCALCDKQDNEQQQHKRQKRGKSSLFLERMANTHTHTKQTETDRKKITIE
jgi:hypothetical protein